MAHPTREYLLQEKIYKRRAGSEMGNRLMDCGLRNEAISRSRIKTVAWSPKPVA
jgi:hypothetical protein